MLYNAHLLPSVVLSLLLIQITRNFTFAPPSIQLSTLSINSTSTYTFGLNRRYDNNLFDTPWNTEPVPGGATIDVYFPVEYRVLTRDGGLPVCNTIVINDELVGGTFGVSVSGVAGALVIKISGAIPNDLAIATATVVIDGILNPSPAVTTGAFTIKIGNDQSAASTAITMQSASFSSCTLGFTPSQVNTTGNMIVSVVLANSIPRNGSLEVRFPVSRQWRFEISAGNLLPIGGNLSCTLLGTGGSMGFLSGVTCVGSLITGIVTVQPVYSSNSSQQEIIATTQLSFSINGLFSPPTTESVDTLQISSLYPISGTNYGVDTCTPLITGLTTKSMPITITSTSSPLFVNILSGFRVNFTITDTIAKTDYFQLQFPLSFPINYMFKLSSLALGTTSYSNTTGYLTFQRTAQAVDSMIGESHYITFQVFTAPPSIRPSGTIRFVVLSARGFEKYAGTGTITAVAKSYSSVLSVSNTTVGVLSNYTLAFTLADPLTTTAMIILTIPSTISITGCPRLSPTPTIAATPTCIFTNTTANPYTLTLKNINSSSNTITSNQALTIIFTNVINYFSAITLQGITMKIYYTDDIVDLVAGSTSNTVMLTPGVSYVRSVTVLDGKNRTLQKPVAYEVGVVLESGMPVAGGVLLLEMDASVKIGNTNTSVPCDIKLVQSTNQSSIISQTAALIIATSTVNSSQFSLKLPSTFTYPPSSSSILLITLPLTLALRNPPTTAPISLKISSYDNQTIGNLIDSGVMWTSGVIYEAMLVSSFRVAGRTSWVNLGVGDYSFVLWVSGDIGATQYVTGSVAVMGLPVELAIDGTGKCYSSSGADLGCTILSSSNSVTIPLDNTRNYRANIPTTGTNTIQFDFTVTKIRNALSFRPTSPFSLQLRTSSISSFHLYGTDSTSLTVINNVTIIFINITYIWSTTVYGGLPTELRVYFVGVFSGMYELGVDVSHFSLQGGIGANVGVFSYEGCMSGEVLGIFCELVVANTSSKVVRIKNIINSTATQFPSQFTLILQNLLLTPQSPSQTTPNPYTIPLSGSDSASYPIYLSPSTVQFRQMCTLPCQTCPSITQPSYCLSCYTNSTISLLKYLYRGSCYVACPAHTFYYLDNPSPNITQYAFTCTDCVATCNSCGPEPGYCLSCYTNYSLYVHVDEVSNATLSECLLVCPNGTYTATNTTTPNLTSQCLPCSTPCQTCTSSPTSCLSCLPSYYQYHNRSLTNPPLQCLLHCPTQITVPNVTAMTCVYCESPCAFCVGVVGNCTECIGGYYRIGNGLLNGLTNVTNGTQEGYTCLLVCPAGSLAVNSSGTCQPCTAPCSTCNNSLTSCLICILGYYLSSTTPNLCTQTCQSYSFPNTTTSSCQLCRTIPSLNCLNCTSATQCLSCDDPSKPGYLYFPANRSCLASVPDGYINGSGTAVPCDVGCRLCWGAVGNCTACFGGASLYLNGSDGVCMGVCPAGYTAINSTCKTCLSPCLQCSNTLTNCTACLSQFYSYNGLCIEAYQCPLYHYINQSSKACLPCPAPCSACTNSTFCLTCHIGLLFESTGQCLSTCPPRYAPTTTTKIINNTVINNTRICLLCLSPCAQCSNLRENCTVCVEGYYFYARLWRCFLPCPLGITVPVIANGTGEKLCMECVAPCRTCTQTVNKCLTCVQDYYLEINSTSCVAVCASGQYAYGTGVCQLCVAPCLTCRSETQCITCVTGTYYYQANSNTVSCLTTCPITHAIIVSNTCTSCEPGCTNCTTASSYTDSICSVCSNPYALYSDHCYQTCPSSLILYLNTTQNRYYCLTSQEYAQAQLGITLDSSNLLPLPFTVIAVFLAIATFMSRMQSRGTYIIGVLYCWLGVLEVGVLVYFLVGVYGRVDAKGQRVTQYREETYVLGVIGLGVIGGLNLLGLLIQTPYLWADLRFRAWAKHKASSNRINQQESNPNNPNSYTKSHVIKGTKIKSRILDPSQAQSPPQSQTPSQQCCSHKCTFITITVLSAISSYKLKLLLFTGLFRFTSLSFPLESVHKFRVFNIFSFLGMLQEGFIFYFVYLIAKEGISYEENSLLFLEVVDVVIIYGINVVFAILSVKKDEGFFGELLEELDEVEIDDARKKEQQRMDDYARQQKEKEIKRKISSLHPDFIGMDSYHSLKNAVGNQDAQEQVLAVESVHEQRQLNTGYESGFRTTSHLNCRQKPKLSRKQSDNILYTSQGNPNASNYQIENEVNHNIMSPLRPYQVTSANWVEVDRKDKQISEISEQEIDRTITKGNKRGQDNRGLGSQIKNSSRIGSKVANSVVENAVSKKLTTSKPQIPNPTLNNNPKRAQYLQQPPVSNPPQTYTNILYRKQSQPIPDRTSKPALNNSSRAGSALHLQVIKTQQKLSLNNNNNNPTTNLNVNSNNNKAVLLSNMEKEEDEGIAMGELSYEPILPFVHQDGELRYKDTKSNNNSKRGKNIFDVEHEEIDEPVLMEEKDDDGMLEVIQLQHQENKGKSSVKELSRLKKDRGVDAKQPSRDLQNQAQNGRKISRVQKQTQNIMKVDPLVVSQQQQHQQKQLQPEQNKAQIKPIQQKKQQPSLVIQNQQRIEKFGPIGTINHRQTNNQNIIVQKQQFQQDGNRQFFQQGKGLKDNIKISQQKSHKSLQQSQQRQQQNQYPKQEPQQLEQQQKQQQSQINQQKKSLCQSLKTIKPKQKQQIVKYYVYKRESKFNSNSNQLKNNQIEDDSEQVSREIYKKERELNRIKASASKMERMRRSREKLKVQRQVNQLQEKQKQQQKQQLQKEEGKSHHQIVENQSIQLDQAMLNNDTNNKNNQQKQLDAFEQENLERQREQIQQKEQQYQKNKQEQQSEQQRQKHEEKQIEHNEHHNSIFANSQDHAQTKTPQNLPQSQQIIPESTHNQKNPNELKNLSQGSLQNNNNKANIIDNLSENQSHNFTNLNLKPFQFDESSLKKAKFEFQQQSQQKLSNPFDGSIDNSAQILNQLREGQSQFHSAQQIQEDQQQEGLNIGDNHAETLDRAQGDDTVPMGVYERGQPGWNRITEENSEMERSQGNTVRRNAVLNGSNHQQQQQQYEEQQLEGKQINNHNNIKLVQILKSAHPKLPSKRKKIPIQDSGDNKNQEIKMPKLHFKPPNQQQLHERSLARKDKMKYPLRQESGQGRKDREIEDGEDEKHGDAGQRMGLRRSMEKVQVRQVQSQQQFVPKNIPKLSVPQLKQTDTYADLTQWQHRFQQPPHHPYQLQHKYSTECMQIPAKPIIDSSSYDHNNGSSQLHDFQHQNQRQYDYQYQETDKSYHKGKLYQFEQSSNIFEKESGSFGGVGLQSRQELKGKQKSKSRKKNRRYREGGSGGNSRSKEKSSMNSIEKIYLQKLDRK